MADNAPKVLLRSEETDGAVAVVELTGRGRPPLHHHNFDEAFDIVQGGRGLRDAPAGATDRPRRRVRR
jgi:hypothetical protein